MADSKISALASGAPAQAGDEYIVARSGANYKLTLTNIAASMPPIGATTPNTGAFTTLSASGAASFADGSSSAPAITNTGDTNTGVYFPAADEVAVAAGGSVAAAFNSNGVFFRNRIINGDMRIDQRNAGASVTFDNNVFPVDRFRGLTNLSSKATAQQSSVVPTGFVNSVLVTSSSAYSLAAGDYFGIGQRIEGTNISDLGWGTASARAVTLSFWVRSSLTGTFGGALSNSNGTRSYPFTYSISVADTWEYKTITVPGDTSGTWLTTNGSGIQLVISLGTGATLSGTAGAWAGANYFSATGAVSVISTNGATFYITGVQLESGSVATPFERRPFGTELMLCQRYYEKSYEQATVPGTATGFGAQHFPPNTNTASALYAASTIKFAVVKRTAATIRCWDWAGNASRVSDFTLGGLVRTDNLNSIQTLTAYQQAGLVINAQAALTYGSVQWDASAEL
jgi:hypothetical protein